MLVGPWIQEFVHLTKEAQDRYLDELEELEMTALGINLLPFVLPEEDARPGGEYGVYKNGDLLKTRKWYIRMLKRTARKCKKRGITLIVYGFMTPDVRRGFEIDSRLSVGGKVLTRSDWSQFSPLCQQGYAASLRRVYSALKGFDNVIHVDSVEPYLLDSVETQIHGLASSIWPGCITGGIEEIHINPGQIMEPGKYIAFDGWGVPGRQWNVKDENGELSFTRPYAALPGATGSRKDQIGQINRYFVKTVEDAARYGSGFCLTLPTTNWGVAKQSEAVDPDFKGHPGVATLRVEPWWDVHKALRRLLRAGLPTPEPIPGDATDLSKADIVYYDDQNVSKWPVTATLHSVNIYNTFIEQQHNGGWPHKELAMSSGGVGMFEGNVWVGRKVGSKIEFGTYEYIVPNGGEGRRKSMGVPDESPDIAQAFKNHMNSSWVPKRGETVYFFSSSLARRSGRSVKNQRSNVVKMIWPY